MANDTKVAIKCGCCREEELLEGHHAFDAELKVPVCRDCQTQLRWAQARLKEQGIKGCTPDPR